MSEINKKLCEQYNITNIWIYIENNRRNEMISRLKELGFEIGSILFSNANYKYFRIGFTNHGTLYTGSLNDTVQYKFYWFDDIFKTKICYPDE